MPTDLLQNSAEPKDLFAGSLPPEAQRSAIEIALGLNRPPLNEAQRAALRGVMVDHPWGSGFPKFTTEMGGNVTDLTGSPVAGGVTKFLLDAVPAFFTMTKGLPAPSEDQISANALAGQRQAILEKGRKLGLVVPPSQANPNAGNRLLESVGGKAATAQQAAADNADVAYKIAQREAGLAPSEAITMDSLKAARDKLSQPYRDIAALENTGPLSKPPFGSPAQTLEDLRDARKEATNLWTYYKKSGIPKIQRQAQEASAKADALEQTLEAQAADAGRPDLVQQLREARTAIAKNFTVQRAMRGSTFEPAALARLQSRGNTPLGGDLETLMQMYKDFQKAMVAPQVGGSVGVNQLLPWLGGSAGGIAGAALGGVHGAGLGAPAGVILGQAIPPVTRAAMLSPLYQSLFANVPQGLGNPSLLRILADPAVAAQVGLHRP